MSSTTKTNGSATSGVKRRASTTSGSAKKRAKKTPKAKVKEGKTNGTDPEQETEPEQDRWKPDGWDQMPLYKSFLRASSLSLPSSGANLAL